jgi:hypothetical protein
MGLREFSEIFSNGCSRIEVDQLDVADTAGGVIEGEDSYHSGPVNITSLASEELPQEYRNLMGASSAI